jgi:hypothetical protein
MHSSKRIRFLSSSLQAMLLRNSEVLAVTENFIGESASPEILEAFLGASCLSAHDIDRSCSSQSRQALEILHRGLQETQMELILAFVSKVVYEPDLTFAWLYPTLRTFENDSQVSTTTGPKTNAKEMVTRDQDDDGESEAARSARWRTSAIGTIKWLLGAEILKSCCKPQSKNHEIELPSSISMSSEIHSLLDNATFWSIFISEAENEAAFGANFPSVRHSAWMLLQALVLSHGGTPYISEGEGIYIHIHLARSCREAAASSIESHSSFGMD